jgi:hypothetical protein
MVTGFEHLPGTNLPAGEFTITPQEAERLTGALLAVPSPDDTAHPIWAYIATQRGIDISIAGLCALAEFDVADGPMLGSVEIEYGGPVRIGMRYRVTGEVVGLERKVGRKTGTFDILTYRLAMAGPDGAVVTRCTNTFILPRRESL